MSLVSTRMTAAEFLALPEDPDKTRYELVDGEVIVSPSPNLNHAWVVTQLVMILGSHVRDRDLGLVFSDIDTYFTPGDVRRPDVFFFTNARSYLVSDDYPEAPPDLCIEVLSPSNRNSDRVEKFRLYEKTGVPAYWIVDPIERTFEAYSLRDGVYDCSVRGKEDDIVSAPPFNDLNISLSRLWRPKLNIRP